MSGHLRCLLVLLPVMLVAVTGQVPASKANLLFVGNSLTSANDLPGMVATLSKAAGRPMQVESVALPDFGLEEHWQQGDARKAIARGGWDIRDPATGSIRTARITPAPGGLRQTLRQRDHCGGCEDRLVHGVALAAAAGRLQRREPVIPGRRVGGGGLLLPVGDAWREAWAIDAKLALYGPDGFHPSQTGTYLAALVIYRQLTGTAPPTRPHFGSTADQATVLQRAAERAIGTRR